MAQDEIEAFFLNDVTPLFENIQEAGTETEAMVLASAALKTLGEDYTDADLTAVVRKIREWGLE